MERVDRMDRMELELKHDLNLPHNLAELLRVALSCTFVYPLPCHFFLHIFPGGGHAVPLVAPGFPAAR